MDSEGPSGTTATVAPLRVSKNRGTRPGNAVTSKSRHNGKNKDVVKDRKSSTPAERETPENATPSQKSFERRRKLGHCNLWTVTGSCRYGDRCKFKHDNEKHFPVGDPLNGQRSQTAGGSMTFGSSSAADGAGSSVSDTRKRHNRQDTNERKQEVHSEAVRLKQEREQVEREAERRRHRDEIQARWIEEAEVVEQYIVSETSLVTCGAGLDIQSVIPGFDLCRITVKNLPGDTKHNEISDFFTQQGVDIHSFYITAIRPTGRKKEATVLTKAEQGEAIALGLEGIEFREEVVSFEVSANASWGSMCANSGHDRPSISISWWMPSEVNIVTYDSSDQAMRQASRLNARIWNNRRLRASVNTRPTGPAARYFTPHSIVIHGCQPGSAIDSGFQEFVQSTNIRTSKSYVYIPDEALRNVQQTVIMFAGAMMDTFEVLNDGSKIDGLMRVQVSFSEWEQAQRACVMLNKRWAVDLRGGHAVLQCRVQEPFMYSITIPRQQYEVQKRQWDNLSVKSPGSDAHVLTRIGDRGAVFIKVVGQDKKATGSLKVRVEGLIAGQKLDSTTHWHPSFMTRRGRVIFENLPDTLQVFVRNDFKSKSLRVYGDRDRVEEAKRIIKDQVDSLSQMETIRVLARECTRGFMREGLGKLRELIGEENVEVILTTIPYRVKVKGGVEATHHLDRIMTESLAVAHDDVQSSAADRETCPICFDDVSNPEELICGHTYCSTCLRHFLSSASDGKNFPLVCVGSEAQCKVPISIPSIRRFLPENAFQNLVEAAFTSYLESHPQEFKYCTTPDCKQLYRRRADKEMLQCPSCFAVVCSLCDGEGHEGMSCEERRTLADPETQERLNDELARTQGFKKCPECGIFIEKTDGCNHMTCRCGAHICWICLRVFPREMIYTHLNSAHGGFWDQPVAMNNGNMGDGVFLAMQIQEAQRLEQIRAMREVQEHAVMRPNVAEPDPLRVNGLRPAILQPADGHIRQDIAFNANVAQPHPLQILLDEFRPAIPQPADARIRQDIAFNANVAEPDPLRVNGLRPAILQPADGHIRQDIAFNANVAQPHPLQIPVNGFRPAIPQPVNGRIGQGRGLNEGSPMHPTRKRLLRQARTREEQRRRDQEQAEIRRRQREQEQCGCCILM